jgi:hypothetical protein
MHSMRRKPRRMTLAVLWVVSTVWIGSTVTPVASQTATNDRSLQMEETAPLMSLVCPAQYHPVCGGQPLEAAMLTAHPLPQTGAGQQAWSEKTISIDLVVPKALVRALLTGLRYCRCSWLLRIGSRYHRGETRNVDHSAHYLNCVAYRVLTHLAV